MTDGRRRCASHRRQVRCLSMRRFIAAATGAACMLVATVVATAQTVEIPAGMLIALVGQQATCPSWTTEYKAPGGMALYLRVAAENEVPGSTGGEAEHFHQGKATQANWGQYNREVDHDVSDIRHVHALQVDPMEVKPPYLAVLLCVVSRKITVR